MTEPPPAAQLTQLPQAAVEGDGPVILHATAVAYRGRGLLILGPSGAGKSALALRLLALGAGLISDDRTVVQASPAGVAARCPAAAIRGLIEARGVGLLRVQPVDVAPLALVVDLAVAETQRLPISRHIMICKTKLPLVLRVQNDHLAEALLIWLSQEQLD